MDTILKGNVHNSHKNGYVFFTPDDGGDNYLITKNLVDEFTLKPAMEVTVHQVNQQKLQVKEVFLLNKIG